MSCVSSSECEDEEACLVIDNGSGTCKAGFGGDDAPRAVFPAFVGSTSSCTSSGGEPTRCTFVGDGARVEFGGGAHIRYPIDHGIVTHWDGMEKVSYVVIPNKKEQLYSAFSYFFFPKLCLILKNRFLVRLSSNFQERLFIPSSMPKFIFGMSVFSLR